MVVGFFTQNVRRGGLDTFIIHLLRHWPAEQELILFCNGTHPGLDDLHTALSPRVRIVAYDFLIAQDVAERAARWPVPLRVLMRGTFWLFGFPYMVHKIRHLLRRHDCERLMVINGGYPGGDACLAATIAWAGLNPGQPRAWHNFHNLVLPYTDQPWRRFKDRWIDRRVARSAAGFVTVSAACLATLRERPLLLDSQQRFVHNGIEPLNPAPKASLRTELGLPESAQLILMLAVYEPRKGHAFMMKAMEAVIAACPQAYLLVCGDGSAHESEVIRHLHDSSPARDHILLQGHRQDVPDLMAQADVLVMPSQGQESFGYTVVEAMACGLPTVVTDIGGLPEVAEEGVTGYVVRHDDTETFAEKIIRLLQDPVLRQQMGDNGRRRFDAKFQAKRMAEEYFSLLKNH